MHYVLIIPGKLCGLNEMTEENRKNFRAGAALKRKEQNRVVRSIKAQLTGLRIHKPVRLHYIFIEPNRKRDKDNISGSAHKIIQDALVEAGVLENDGWRNIDGYVDDFGVDKDHPHITVRIEVIEDGKQRSNASV